MNPCGKLLLLGVMGLSLVEVAEGLKCHQCESFVNCKQSDKFCMGEACFKKRLPDGKGSFRYSKGCSAKGDLAMGCRDISDMEKHCYCDDQDVFCNAAPATGPSLALAALASLGLWIALR